ncbi:MAG: alpha/beta fold hydrolase [Clostridiales bacterium]|nr:alpha/beta fold hydrolase [Clostridiales bacterium]
MKRTAISLSLILAAAGFSQWACAATLSEITTESVAPYVSPNNRIKGPGSMTYMPDGLTYLKITDKGTCIKAFDTLTGNEKETVLDLSNTRETKIPSIEGFALSPDASKMIVWRNSTPIYRHSIEAEYYVFNIRRNILLPLSVEHSHQRAPIFSPDNRMVAFVADNNIYIKKLDYNSEVAVTTDGDRNMIINGVPDWSYEEEFSTLSSMAWAPGSDMLCYIKYDESKVPMFSFPLYQGACDPMDEYALYPGRYSYKYPVAGQPNSVVSVHSYDVDTRKTKPVELSSPSIEYIPKIQYAPNNQLLVITLNREQSRLEIYSANPRSTVVKSILVDESKTWIDPASYEDFVVEENSFVYTSSRSGYNHLYRYSFTGQQLSQLTRGDWDVTAYYGTDAQGNYYYQSTRNGAINRTVTRVDRKGIETTIGNEKGTTNLTFAPAKNFFTMSFSDAATPTVYTLCNSKLKAVRKLEDNNAVASRFASSPKREFFTINSDGNELNAYMVKPDGFSESKRYPVIMWLYNGPGSQEVLNRWSIDWQQAAAKLGFLVVCVDGRGTGGRGKAFQDIVYGNLGYYETIDQTNAARYMATLPYVDGERIGVAGWSYGGYETLMCAQATDTPFKAAVAVAPVTSWHFYDTIYTERYMNTPQANSERYFSTAPLNHTNNLAARLLIMSGTADDNVHFSNTVEYVSHLQASGKLCDMLIFPNMNHSINGCDSRALVYTNMIKFFKNNL